MSAHEEVAQTPAQRQGAVGSLPQGQVAHMARLRRAFVESLREDDVRAIVGKLAEQAKEGDLRATRLLLQYALGKPWEAAFLSFAPAPPVRAASPVSEQPIRDVMTQPRLNDLIVEQIRWEQKKAADTKREKTAPSATKGVPTARTEAMPLVNLPTRS